MAKVIPLEDNNMDEKRKHYDSLRPRYVLGDPTIDKSEVEQLAIEFHDFQTLLSDRALEVTCDQYTRGTLNSPDPSIFHDYKADS